MTVILKAADRGSVVAVQYRDDYLKVANQLEDKDVYEENWNDPSILVHTTMHAIEKIRVWGHLSNDTLNYFLIEDTKFTFYFANILIMFLADPSFQIVDFIQKISHHF